MINYRQPPGRMLTAGRVQKAEVGQADAAQAGAERADRIARRAAGESVQIPAKAPDVTRTRSEQLQDQRQAAAGRSTSDGRIRKSGRSFAERAEEKEARALAEALQSAASAVTVGMFPALFRQCWPELLKGLLQPGLTLNAEIPGELVATLDKASGKAVWDIILGGSGGAHDFDPRFDGENIYRTAGHRCIIGFHDGWELMAENPTPVTGNGTYWMKWVYTTDAAPGSFTEGYGTPPTQDTTCTVALLWTVTDGVVAYHERGAKRFFDWDVC